MSSILPFAHRIDRHRFVQLVLLSLCLSLALIRVGAAPITGPNRIEVFTVGPKEVTVPAAARLGLPPGTELQVYRVDGIKRIQTNLSRDLPNDPENSKRIVLQRIQQLPTSERVDLQHSAVGLAKAVQYGVDRYPAIVFDGKLAIYGVTHLREALHRYQQ